MPAAAPPPPPRHTRRAWLDALPIGEACACADSGRFGVRPVSVAPGSTALPVHVRDGLVGAADEQRHGGFGAAAERRIVQRCPPAGTAQAQSAQSATDDHRRTGRGEGRTRCCSWCSGRRARRRASRRSRDGRCAPHTSRRCTHSCARRRNCGGGEPRSAHTPRIGYAQQPIPVHEVGLGVPGGSCGGFVF
jgi:hypothetical protein